MSEIKGDAAKQAVDHLICQGLVDPEQRYNIAQVIREKYETELASERARRIKAEEVVDRLLKQKFAVIDSLTVWLGVIQKVASEYRTQYPRVEKDHADTDQK